MRQANPSPPTPPKRPGRRQRDSRVTEGTQYSDFLAPKYWGAWLFIGFMYVIGYIPGKVRIGLAHLLTPLAMRLARSRHHIAKTNIDLCFPEKTEAERKKLVRDTFFANVLGFFETADSWVRPIERMRSRVHWEGVEHLDAAEKDGQGVLLVGGHFAILDMAGALFGLIKPYDLVYRKHDNVLLNYFMTRSRERWCERTLARRDMKGLIRSLREGRIVWYAPDQDYGRKASEFVPFFNIQTATVTMTSKLAKSGNARVIPVFFYRNPSLLDYSARFGPPLPIPSGDDIADAACFNAWLEGCVREAPDQYLWLHKRFKTRPEGEPSVY